MKVIVEKYIEVSAHEFKNKEGYLYVMKCAGLVDGVSVSIITLKTFDAATYNDFKVGNTYEVEEDVKGKDAHSYIITPPPKKGRGRAKAVDMDLEHLKIRASLAIQAMQTATDLAKRDTDTKRYPHLCQAYDRLYAHLTESVFEKANNSQAPETEKSEQKK